MSFAKVANGATVQSRNKNLGFYSISPLFGAATTAGNLLVGYVTSVSASSVSCSDSGYTHLSSGNAHIFFKENCAANETAPTFTQVGPTFGTDIAGALVEYSGAAIVSPLDQTKSYVPTNGFSATITLTMPAADSSASALLLACVADDWVGGNGLLGYSETITPSGGTLLFSTDDAGTKDVMLWRFDGYAIAGNGGSSADVFSKTSSYGGTGGVNNSGLVIATIKPYVAPTSNPDAAATAIFSQRKLDRCQNGNLLEVYRSSSLDGRFRYSSDGGVSWIDISAMTITGFSNGSLFVDLDDYAHIAWKQNGATGGLLDGYIYYMRGTPDSGRTTWTWTTPLALVGANYCNYPDVVAHREGTGWAVHFAFSSTDTGTQQVSVYRRHLISSSGVITFADQQYSSDLHHITAPTYSSLDFNHTGDGKTVAGATPHIYTTWTTGTSGTSEGIKYRKFTYAAGTWGTGDTEVAVSTTAYVNTSNASFGLLFDGTRSVIAGTMQTTTGLAMLMWDVSTAGAVTARTLISPGLTTGGCLAGSMSYDSAGNVYLFGRPNETNNRVHYYKWTRSTASLSGPIIVDTPGTPSSAEPWVSVRRSYNSNQVEFVYTEGSVAPYGVTYAAEPPQTRPVRAIERVAGYRSSRW